MQLEWGVIFTQVVGFLIVLGLLKKYAWGKLLDFIEHRRETIAAEFEGIEKSKQEVAGLRQNLENELADIEQTRRAKIQEAATEAHKLANDIKEEARKESLALQIKTKHDVEAELLKANASFRDNMVHAVVTATEKIIKERLDTEQHKKLIGNFIDEVRAK